MHELPKPIKDLQQLKELASGEAGLEFYILLNGGVKSNKRIWWDDEGKKFTMVNYINDSAVYLTETELTDNTNIATGIANHRAFYELNNF